MKFLISALSDRGIEKSVNQDCCRVRPLATERGDAVFAVLCDGMGGLKNGEVASSALADAFDRWAKKKFPGLYAASGDLERDICREWFDVIVDVDAKIKRYGSYTGDRMGTTVTALLLTPEKYLAVNVGDTRAYEISDGIRRITKDHSLVAREVELGHITEDEARTDRRRNILLRCVGASEIVRPDFFSGETRANAVYMLCSDGFRHEITEDEIFSGLDPTVMTDETVMAKRLSALVELNKQRLERDNISVIALKTL